MSKALNVDKEVLAPLIFVFSAIGCYSMRNSLFDVRVMIIFGIIGYFMKRFGYPAAAFILGYILSSLLESNLLRALSLTGGDPFAALFNSKLSFLMIGLTVLSLLTPYFTSWLGKRKQAKEMK